MEPDGTNTFDESSITRILTYSEMKRSASSRLPLKPVSENELHDGQRTLSDEPVEVIEINGIVVKPSYKCPMELADAALAREKRNKAKAPSKMMQLIMKSRLIDPMDELKKGWMAFGRRENDFGNQQYQSPWFTGFGRLARRGIKHSDGAVQRRDCVVCNGPRCIISCENCGYTCFGRRRRLCMLHFREMDPTDVERCPKCNHTSFILEYPRTPLDLHLLL